MSLFTVKIISATILIVLSCASYALALKLGKTEASLIEKPDRDHYEMRYKPSLMLVAALLLVLGIVWIFYADLFYQWNTASLYAVLLASAVIFAAFFAWFAFKTFRYGVFVRGNVITVQPSFGKAYEITFDEIRAYQHKRTSTLQGAYVIKTQTKDGKIFKVTNTMTYFDRFLETLRENKKRK